jgi:hypothetical protein
MSLKKRGLGRGLEVLLADTENNNEDDKAAAQFMASLNQERQNLLQEAEAVKDFLEQLEEIIRAGL